MGRSGTNLLMNPFHAGTRWFGAVACLALVAGVTTECGSTSGGRGTATPVPMATGTAAQTYTPNPTYTAGPLCYASGTATVPPTYTPRPSYTAVATYSPAATYTAFPSYTPAATLTPAAGAAWYHEDFDGSSPGVGWSTGSRSIVNSWRIGGGPVYNGTASMGTSGTSGGYGPFEDSWALSPPFAIPGSSNLALFWYQYFNFSAGGSYDGGLVEISTNGGSTWSVVNPSPGYAGNPIGWANAAFGYGTAVYNGYSNGWILTSVALAPYAGQTIRVRFHLGSSACGQTAGWYLDEVAIR